MSAENISISGGVITAEGGENGAAGIGGGGHDGILTGLSITGGWIKTAGSPKPDPSDPGNANAIGGGASKGPDPLTDVKSAVIIDGAIHSGQVYGDCKLPSDVTLESGDTLTISHGSILTIPQGYTLTIPQGATLTILQGATLINHGTIVNYGKIDGTGTGDGTVLTPAKVSVSVTSGGSPVTSAILGSTVTITATVSQANANALARAAANQVEFFVGTDSDRKSLGTANVSGNTAFLSDVIIAADTGWKLGANTITAEYGGGSNCWKPAAVPH